MPRLKFAVALCLALSARPTAALAGDGTGAANAPVSPPGAAGAPSSIDPRAAAGWLFPGETPDAVLQRETFIALMGADKTLALTQAVQAAAQQASDAAKAAGKDGDAATISTNINALAPAADWHKQVVAALSGARSLLADDAQKQDYSKTSPLIDALLEESQPLQMNNPAELLALVDNPEYGGSSAAPPRPNCPGGKAGSALDELKKDSGNGNLDGTTGDCPTGPGSNTPTAAGLNSPADTPTPPASTPPSVTDQHTTTGPPPAPGQDSGGGGGGGGGLGSLFSSLPVNQMLAGVGFGAAVGMLLGFGTPMGMVGGALIGGLIGAVFGSGVIGKLFGGGGTGGS